MAPTPLYKKLRLEPKYTVFVFNGPRKYNELLPGFPGTITFATPGEKAGFVHLFVKDKAEFDQCIDKAFSGSLCSRKRCAPLLKYR